MSSKDTQVGGEHYKLAIQPVDFIQRNGIPFMEGNVIKYVVRHRNKHGEQDLRKAIHYLEMLIEQEYGSERSDERIPQRYKGVSINCEEGY